MKYRLNLPAAVAAFMVAATVGRALDIQIGTRATTPGSTAGLSVTLANAPTNLSAFAFRIWVNEIFCPSAMSVFAWHRVLPEGIEHLRTYLH